ncbi:DUF7352 domain-containing protein [Nocardia wallacei]|uniref:DUF7352 domain-containing protein n=1 Tax=Nocardia wallacei TaxID=480035 RepID=UPI0024583FF9|nr:hypothetical protein [Nocardia wallacei]
MGDLNPADLTIHKIVLPIMDRQSRIRTGRIERWLTVQVQNNEIVAWYEVDLSRGGETEVEIAIVGTGNPRPMFTSSYLGTAPLHGGVWHVYELAARWTPGGFDRA